MPAEQRNQGLASIWVEINAVRAAINIGECMLEHWMSIVAVIIAGAVGYLAGVLRDRGQNIANRNARHEDETLTAAAALVDGARRMSRASHDLASAIFDMSAEIHPEYVGPLNAERRAFNEDKRNTAWRNQDAALAIFQPALLKLSILSPALGAEGERLIRLTARTGNHEAWEKQSEEYLIAENSFMDKARAVLRSKSGQD